jgi:hypothetical protein
VTLTTPLPAGEVAVIWVAELTVKLAASAAPKSTAVTPVKSAPVMTTDVPPLELPSFGLMPVSVGV